MSMIPVNAKSDREITLFCFLMFLKFSVWIAFLICTVGLFWIPSRSDLTARPSVNVELAVFLEVS